MFLFRAPSDGSSSPRKLSVSRKQKVLKTELLVFIDFIKVIQCFPSSLLSLFHSPVADVSAPLGGFVFKRSSEQTAGALTLLLLILLLIYGFCSRCERLLLQLCRDRLNRDKIRNSICSAAIKLQIFSGDVWLTAQCTNVDEDVSFLECI